MSDSTATTEVQLHIDEDGREFGSVHVPHAGGDGLVVHFSAFFGSWGDAKAYRDRFQGYFHRLKMLGSCTSHNWLFLCDQYGAFDNGTYYTGERGDFFVERATRHIIEKHIAKFDYSPDRTVLVGSSMGATAAIKFGLEMGVAGIVAVSPHIDLDICAARQNRMREVAFICPDGAPLAEHNHQYTRQIRGCMERETVRPLPRLFVQSCADDEGVHDEQVRPLVGRWRDKGGEATLDERPVGGHTSDYATAPLLLDVIGRLIDGHAIDVTRYQQDGVFAGQLTRPPWSHRIRGRLSRFRSRVLA